MAQVSKAVRQPSKQALKAEAAELQAEADYRKHLAQFVTNSTGWRTFKARAERLRARANAA